MRKAHFLQNTIYGLRGEAARAPSESGAKSIENQTRFLIKGVRCVFFPTDSLLLSRDNKLPGHTYIRMPIEQRLITWLICSSTLRCWCRIQGRVTQPTTRARYIGPYALSFASCFMGTSTPISLYLCSGADLTSGLQVA